MHDRLMATGTAVSGIVSFKVLLVEDSPFDARSVRRVLSRYPLARFEIDHVESIREAMERLKATPPDVILLDNGLPGETGISYLRRTGHIPSRPPVIMLTGQADSEMAFEAIRLGAYDYFPKDVVDSDILGRAVHLTIERFRLDSEIRRGNEQVIFAIADAVEGKDATTSGHLHRIGSYAALLADALGLDEHDRMILQYGGVLHDIGKISISESILGKPGPLTETEWVEMKKHPIIGEQICKPLRFANEIGLIIRHHHERWDGTGYVDGLARENIPFLARVIGVADSFDAMTSDRPYRPSLSLDEAKGRLLLGAGSQWDRDIVLPFLDGLSPDLLKSAHAA